MSLRRVLSQVERALLHRSACAAVRPASGLSTPKKQLLSYERAVSLSPGQFYSAPATFSKDLVLRKDSPIRRWVRDPTNELCCHDPTRLSAVLTTYETTFKFESPDWADILSLPCGHPVALDIRARHINVSLRNLVQKGHALYIISACEHSVLHPNGLAMRAHIVCSLDVKDEHLLTQITYEGPVNAAQPDGRWDVVAISTAHSTAMPFVRKEMP